jgi:hypothetical protein
MDFKPPTENGTKLADCHHQSLTAELAQPRVIIRLGNLLVPIEKLQLHNGRQFKRKTQNAASLLEFGAAGTVMQTKMTDAHKAIRQNMGEKAADEFHGGEGHQLLFALVTVIEILERDCIFPYRHNAVIGNGNAEDVATEILNQFFRAIKRGLNIDFPIFDQGLLQHTLNIQPAVIGIQFAICPELGDGKTKAVTELIGKQFDGKEKLARSRIPTVASGGGYKCATGDDEVDMQSPAPRRGTCAQTPSTIARQHQ